MNFLSVNVRGFGIVGKLSWVRELRKKHEVDFLAVQETKIVDSQRFDGSQCWGMGDIEWDMVDATGRSGGIVNVWNKKVFRKSSSVSDPNFLLTSGHLIEDGTTLNVMNIYAPQKVVAKRALWEKILSIINGLDGLWVILGDFNSVRWPEERKNSRFNRVAASDFNEFIDSAGLQEYTMRGNKFTFLAANNGDFKLSKIDRVLVCQGFFNRWPLACLRALPRDLTDHTPLLLTLVHSNFGYKPFRWFNSWLERPGCEEVVIKPGMNVILTAGPIGLLLGNLNMLGLRLKNGGMIFFIKKAIRCPP